jgi:hypothetical protein
VSDDKPLYGSIGWSPDFHGTMESLLGQAVEQLKRFRDAILVVPPTPEQERDYWRERFIRMRQKRNNKRQTLRSTRLRLEAAYEDLEAMRAERDEVKKELDAMIAAGYEEP